MYLAKVIFQAHQLAQGGHYQHERSNPAEDRANNEIRREDCVVPSRRDRHREVVGHHRVHRHRNRQDHHRHEFHSPLERLPLPVRACPAKRQELVDPALGPGTVARQLSQVRDQRKVEVNQAAGQIGQDRRQVPEQRRAEIRPEEPFVRVRDHPVKEPHPADMDQWKHAADQQAEDRDRFCGACYRLAPGRSRQTQNCRDQRSSVRDPDPKDEIDDIEAPIGRSADPRVPESTQDLVAPGEESPSHDGTAKRDRRDIARARAAHPVEHVVSYVRGAFPPGLWLELPCLPWLLRRDRDACRKERVSRRVRRDCYSSDRHGKGLIGLRQVEHARLRSQLGQQLLRAAA